MSRILVISIVPEEQLAALVQQLSVLYPEAQITALVGAEPGGLGGTIRAEFLVWGSRSAGGSIGEVRGRRCELVVVAHGRDQCLSGSYWKAVAAGVLFGRGRVVLCEDGRLERSAKTAGAVGRAAGQLSRECFVAVLGGVMLGTMLVAVAVADLSEALLGKRRAGGSAGCGKDRM